jgi:hypothetical protein
MKDLLGLDAGTVLPLFGILQRVIRVIMKFVRKGKMLLLKSLKVSMGSEDLEKRPLLPSLSLFYI